ncbi:probable dehydrogenase, putative [Renibacterium salmoninarum ATCC 33209]|uniref:Probable dehydrogenase, putative n=1 Tax=Renibacterium salmoninarum (strain ATCC 33209 / DSM 20767 / JCM 11484 / NBRC 15589 / NCIMB 2235) TaxID=288705 RepID=A9WUX8_RENSM|nr:probable dehydrogenase, putative [Renibacterium salmoninarum ATCC 33209]
MPAWLRIELTWLRRYAPIETGLWRFATLIPLQNLCTSPLQVFIRQKIQHHFVPEAAAQGAALIGAYAISKAAAETALATLEASGPTIILRPHAVYGRGDNTLLPRLEHAAVSGILALPGDGRAMHSLTHIDNLVQAVHLALQHNSNDVFNICDAAPVELSAAIIELLARRGRPVRIRSVNYQMALAAASLAERFSGVLGARKYPLTQYSVAQLALERTYDLSAAQLRLGFRPLATDFTGAETW